MKTYIDVAFMMNKLLSRALFQSMIQIILKDKLYDIITPVLCMD